MSSPSFDSGTGDHSVHSINEDGQLVEVNWRERYETLRREHSEIQQRCESIAMMAKHFQQQNDTLRFKIEEVRQRLYANHSIANVGFLKSLLSILQQSKVVTLKADITDVAEKARTVSSSMVSEEFVNMIDATSQAAGCPFFSADHSHETAPLGFVMEFDIIVNGVVKARIECTKVGSWDVKVIVLGVSAAVVGVFYLYYSLEGRNCVAVMELIKSSNMTMTNETVEIILKHCRAPPPDGSLIEVVRAGMAALGGNAAVVAAGGAAVAVAAGAIAPRNNPPNPPNPPHP